MPETGEIPVTEPVVEGEIEEDLLEPMPGVADAGAAMQCLQQGMHYDPASGQCFLIPIPNGYGPVAPPIEVPVEEKDYTKYYIIGGAVLAAGAVVAVLVLRKKK
jgi:hypothetical protein